ASTGGAACQAADLLSSETSRLKSRLLARLPQCHLVFPRGAVCNNRGAGQSWLQPAFQPALSGTRRPKSRLKRRLQPELAAPQKCRISNVEKLLAALHWLSSVRIIGQESEW